MRNSSEDVDTISNLAVFILFIVGSIVFQILKSIAVKKQKKAPQTAKQYPKHAYKAVESSKKIKVVQKEKVKEELRTLSYTEPTPPTSLELRTKRFTPKTLKKMVISKEILHNPFIDDLRK